MKSFVAVAAFFAFAMEKFAYAIVQTEYDLNREIVCDDSTEDYGRGYSRHRQCIIVEFYDKTQNGRHWMIFSLSTAKNILKTDSKE